MLKGIKTMQDKSNLPISPELHEKIEGAILNIVREEAPEEEDIYESLSVDFSRVDISNNSDLREQWLSFSGIEQDIYISKALLLIWYSFVIPYLIKIYEGFLKEAAEGTRKAIMEKISRVMKKKKGKTKGANAGAILVPINWVNFERELIESGKELGLSKALSLRLSQLTVKELSDNKILLDGILLHVSNDFTPKMD